MSNTPQISDIKILNEPFENSNGNKTPRSALLLFKKEGTFPREMRLGYLSESDIFECIDKHENICLDNCFVDNISLTRYRALRHLEKKEVVNIAKFSANESIFSSQTPLDLSYALFEDGNFSAEHTYFLNGELYFHASKFGNGNISFADSIFNCKKLDFANTIFGNGNISFKNAIFHAGFKDFQYCQFNNGDIIFTNTEFGNGDVSFINSTFGTGDISFKVACFGDGKVDFHYAHFEGGDVSFERTDFGNGFVDFRKVEWANNRINFNRSVFGNGGVSFEESELKTGKFNFKKASIKDGGLFFSSALFDSIEANFEGTTFGKSSIHFNKSNFGTVSLKACHIDNYADLRLAKAELLDLSDTIIRDIVDMKPIDNEVAIKMVNFEGIRLIGRIYIGWHENNVLSLITQQSQTTLQSKAEQFRSLKQNFNETGQYDDEDDAYVYFKRFEARARLQSLLKKNRLNAFEAYPSYAFKWLVFDKVGLYATSPVRVLVSILFTFMIFGFLLFFGELSHLGRITSSVGNPDHLSTLTQSFYHSAITFFTIGYGDTFPQGINRLLSALEGFTGVFMMSYFTVAFVRKILR